ncbi:MAG: hypothetical protein ABIV51_00100, partial [Saprospiraceae bacterium]
MLEYTEGKVLAYHQRTQFIDDHIFICTFYGYDIFVWKFDKQFELIDSAKYSFNSEKKFYPYRIIQGSNDSLYLWMYQRISGNVSSYWMMPLNSDLDSMGLINLADQTKLATLDMQAVPEGYICIGKDLTQLNEDRWGAIITKLDMDFNVEWRDTLGWGSGKWVNLSVEPLKDGGYAAWYAGYDDYDFWKWYHSTFVRLDFNGKELWRYTIAQPAELNGVDIIEAVNGDYIYVGRDLYSGDEVDNKMVGTILRFTNQGILLWRRKFYDLRFGGTSFQTFDFGKELVDGSIVASGIIKDTKTTPTTPVYAPNNIWLVKVDSMGCFEPGCDSTQYLLSTNELAKDASTYYKVYPNPASEIIQFQALDARFNQIDLVQLMDLSGRIILEDHHPDGSLSL